MKRTILLLSTVLLMSGCMTKRACTKQCSVQLWDLTGACIGAMKSVASECDKTIGQCQEALKAK